jgi:hypothetical protein
MVSALTLSLAGSALALAGLWPTASPTYPPTASSGPAASSNMTPAQPGLVVYDTSSGIDRYARRGALVIAGRDNYADQSFKDVSRSGGTVLLYLDHHRQCPRALPPAAQPKLDLWTDDSQVAWRSAGE